jgi:hypothetical protein
MDTSAFVGTNPENAANLRIARQNEAARATDATAWVRSAVVVLIVR